MKRNQIAAIIAAGIMAVSITGCGAETKESLAVSAPSATVTATPSSTSEPSGSRIVLSSPVPTATEMHQDTASGGQVHSAERNHPKKQNNAGVSEAKDTEYHVSHNAVPTEKPKEEAVSAPQPEIPSQSIPTPQPTPAPTPEPTAEPTLQPTAPKQDIAVCNTCGAEMTIDTIAAHGKSHTLNGENFSYYVK